MTLLSILLEAGETFIPTNCCVMLFFLYFCFTALLLLMVSCGCNYVCILLYNFLLVHFFAQCIHYFIGNMGTKPFLFFTFDGADWCLVCCMFMCC